MLRDPCIEIAFENADQIRKQRDAEGQHDIQHQCAHIFRDQSLVDDAAGQHGREQRHHSRAEDRGKHEAELFRIGLQV